MALAILTVEIRFEHDVVSARQRARQLASLLGFDRQDQVRIATAVSEIARNAYEYGREGKVEFSIEPKRPATLQIRVVDRGAGIARLQEILEGRYQSATGMGVGIVGARRLMDRFAIESEPGAGTSVLLEKQLPPGSPPVNQLFLAQVAKEMAAGEPQNPIEEMRRQNQELLATLGELQRRGDELRKLNQELEDTNRGVVALYAELDEKADFLRRASELKTRFLSNMTHEFRTPLNSIMSLSQMLLDRLDGDLNPEQERQVRYIRKGANELSELVNDLLDLAKVEAGKTVVRPTEFDIRELFGAMRGMLRPLLEHNSSVDLVFEEPEEIPALRTDESKLSQILRNFISNALKFTERGEVRVSVRRAVDDRIVFAVSDTGIGIAEEDQERIFEEFTQVEGPHQTKAKGTGLGLALTRKLAGLLGGEVSLRSRLGEGSTFSVTLPRVYGGPAEIDEVPSLTLRVDPARRPVLVVDDNSETLFVYEKYLKGSGFQVIPARTLQEATAALKRFRPFAILLDILLENENTWGLLEDLRRADATREIPVFVITMVENRKKAMAMGAHDFHEKPVSREWLLQRLNSLVEGDRSEPVLLIDDDEVARYVLRGMLAETGCRILEAEGGREGMKLAQTQRPSAVFLDVMMPGMTGFEVLEQLKSDPETAAIPVIMVTSKVLTEEERARLMRGAVAILSKNHSSREEAVARIREAMAMAGLGQPEKADLKS